MNSLRTIFLTDFNCWTDATGAARLAAAHAERMEAQRIRQSVMTPSEKIQDAITRMAGSSPAMKKARRRLRAELATL